MIKTDFSGHLTASMQLTVPFHDVDPAQVAWHGRYFKYFEAARCLLLEGVDYSYRQMQASGVSWPVVDANVRYVRPILLSQEVRVTACLREWELRLVVDYRIDDDQGEICTKARTVQVPVDATTNELIFGSPQVFIDNVQQRLNAQRLGNH